MKRACGHETFDAQCVHCATGMTVPYINAADVRKVTSTTSATNVNGHLCSTCGQAHAAPVTASDARPPSDAGATGWHSLGDLGKQIRPNSDGVPEGFTTIPVRGAEQEACGYAEKGQRLCPEWRCDCFAYTHPNDDPFGLHPEAFTVRGAEQDTTEEDER